MSWQAQDGPQSGTPGPFAGAQAAGPGIWGAGAAPEGASAGPFAPGVNSLLSQCFGNSLSGISVSRGEGAKNRKISADAHTIGQHISLSDHIKEDPGDAHSMEVIGHEVSHALALGGAGKHVINRAGDPGEHAAYDAGRQFKSFVGSGGKQAAPKLAPAHGGQAVIHRFEGGEHKNAVDGALDVLAEAQTTGRANAVNVDPKIAKQMSAEITLANGLKVSPGDITAMMGDFYGAFNKDGTFNPAKSFEAMNDPNNRAEMQAILDRIHGEEKSVKKALNGDGKFEAASAKELEELTLDRKKTTDDSGVTSGYSMLELAEKNNSHFSKKDSSGTDNNMGAYESFHMLALKAAKDGNANLARAYEASAMHFLTDRHAGGHQFDKAGVQQAYKDGGAISPIAKAMSPALSAYDSVRNSDVLSQAATHIVHDHFNEAGVDVKNADGDPGFLAKGDKHWADKDNADNRFQTAKSVYSSYSELEAVLQGKKKPEDIEQEGFKARQTVPQFDDANQKKAEEMASKLTITEVVKEEKENLNIIGPFLKRKMVNAKNWIGDKWDGAKNWLGDTWQGAKDWAGEKWQGAKDWAGEKWEGAKDWAGEKWQGAKEWAGEKWEGAKEWAGEKWEGAKDWAGEKWQGAKEWAGDKWQGAKEWAGDKWQGAKEWAGDKWQGAKEWAGDKWQGTKDWAGDKWQGAKELGGQAADWGKEKLSNAWSGTKSVANKGKEAVSSGWGWAKNKLGF